MTRKKCLTIKQLSPSRDKDEIVCQQLFEGRDVVLISGAIDGVKGSFDFCPLDGSWPTKTSGVKATSITVAYLELSDLKDSLL